MSAPPRDSTGDRSNSYYRFNRRILTMSDPKAEPTFDPFANLNNLRLNQSYAETVGVKKLLKTVPVRKPGRQDFVRTHPEHRLTPAALIELKDDREIYFV